MGKRIINKITSAICAMILISIMIFNMELTEVMADEIVNQSLPEMPLAMGVSSQSSGSAQVLHNYYGDNGVQLFCSEINVSFHSGTHTRQNLVGTLVEGTVVTEDMVMRAALARDYFYSQGYSEASALSQLYVWYIFQNADTGYINQMYALADIAAVEAWIDSVKDEYVIDQAYAYVAGSSQVLSCFSVKRAPKGHVILYKRSSAVQISENHDCYSLEGAVFGIYTDKDCSKLIATLTTDTAGASNMVELDAGEYYVKEITAPEGYLKNQQIQNVTVSADQTAEVIFEDMPGYYSAAVSVEKIDQETNSSRTQGIASLEGAEFTIKYYDGYYTEDNIPSEADRTWVLSAGKTLSDDGSVHYICYLDDKYVIAEKSDALYYWDNKAILPLGTITIEETKAPDGYLLDGAYIKAVSDSDMTKKIYVTQIRLNDDVTVLNGGNAYLSADRVIRGDLKLIKVADKTQERLANVPFRITSLTTGESHIIVTDRNGQASTAASWNRHTTNTNRGETSSDGVWFGDSAPDDTRGALPYDDYRIEELACESNQGMDLLSFEVSIYKDSTTVSLGTLTNDQTKEITIHTSAAEKSTGNKTIIAGKNTTVVDTVILEGLEAGVTYQLYGWQMLQEENENLLFDGQPVDNTYTFTADNEEMKIQLEFTFDSSMLAGQNLVTFEELYDLSTPDTPKKVAEHKDITDADQTVLITQRLISIHTDAANPATGKKEIEASTDQIIIDTVTLEGLEIGTTYQLVGWQMLKEENAELLIAGETLKNTHLFVAESENMDVQIAFAVDASSLGGKSLVTFEELYDLTDTEHPVKVAEHKNIDDSSQTILINQPVITITYEENEPTSTVSSSPKTGDSSPILIYTVACGLALVVLISVICLKKKKRWNTTRKCDRI